MQPNAAGASSPSDSQLTIWMAKLATVLLVVVNKAILAAYCYASEAHIFLKNESQNATLRRVKAPLDWSTFVEGTSYKLTLANLWSFFACLAAVVEMFTARFLVTPVFAVISTCLVFFFPSFRRPLDPILHEFPWNRALMLFWLASGSVSLLYEKNPFSYPAHVVGEYVAVYRSKESEVTYTKPMLMFLAQSSLLAKNYGILLHLGQFEMPPNLESAEDDLLVSVRLVLLLEIVLSFSGLFVAFQPFSNQFSSFFATLLLLDVILNRTVLVSPQQWQWYGLGLAAVAMIFACAATYIIILVETGTIGVQVVWEKRQQAADDKKAVSCAPKRKDWPTQLVFAKLLILLTVFAHLWSHYDYCQLSIGYQLASKTITKTDLATSKSWIFWSPIYLCATVAIVEVSTEQFSRTLFLLSCVLFLLLIQSPEYPPSMDPMLQHINWSQFSSVLSFVGLVVLLVVKLRHRVPKTISLWWIAVKMEDKLEVEVIRRLCLAFVALALNQANSHLLVHLHSSLTSGATSSLDITNIAFSVYLTMIADIVGLYGELNDDLQAKCLYSALLLTILTNYPSILVAPQWSGLIFGFLMMGLVALFGFLYAWITIVEARPEEYKMVLPRQSRFSRKRNRYCQYY